MATIGTPKRETRRNVSLPASLHGEGPRSDVTIRNLSARGMTILVRGTEPPPRGSYVDIRRGSLTMTGQVRWRQGNAIGVRLRDTIDVASLTGTAGPDQTVSRAPLAASMTVQHRAEHSRVAAAILQFATLAAAPIALAAVAGWLVWEKASEPLRLLHDALG